MWKLAEFGEDVLIAVAFLVAAVILIAVVDGLSSLYQERRRRP